MATGSHGTAPRPDQGEPSLEAHLQQVTTLLGGNRVLRKHIRSMLDVHEVIVEGMPSTALSYMVSRVQVLNPADVLQALGISVRTVQRRKETPKKPLSQEQGGRAWKFAEVLAKATGVFGSQVEAEKWLAIPAMALDRRRPIDLLSSPAGLEMVEQLLGRLEYGVYT